MTPESEVVRAHRAAGREFAARGTRSFVRERGAGEVVVCLHGVPASCFLYRKLLDELATRGLRGVAFDLPGLGLASRPETHDYTWTGLGRFCADLAQGRPLPPECDRFRVARFAGVGP